MLFNNNNNNNNNNKKASSADKFTLLFNHSLNELEKMLEDVDSTTESLIQETQTAEQTHKEKMKDLNQKMEVRPRHPKKEHKTKPSLSPSFFLPLLF